MTDDGYFPRGRSLLRAVHEERLVGLHYGQRALAIGALDPRNFVGTIQSSSGRLAPFRRLSRTAAAFETVFFGTRAEADRLLERVDRMHQRVDGELPVDSGPFPAGTHYSAFDPELMLWTVAVIADSGQRFYELFVRELTDDEREALWQDYRRFGALFGMPLGSAPATYGDFRAWWERRLASDRMHLTPEARYTGRAIAFEIPMPNMHGAAKRLHDLVMLGSLPPRVRELYGLPWAPSQARRWRAVVAAMRAGRRLAPTRVARGSCRRNYELVAAIERKRLRNGRPTPQVPAAGELSAGVAAE
ncbi:oxygenase MpaB family protein [Conexibacter arvalis]|uniref:Uncharacterized protein (DUF2236 family) n=1 Tax=Conexibacter arvalis TaxID=912552 RepID=A0A840II18_9ACTN|nr:oxygenase MpaB family protein [Conexibacter arvalis]MBB4663694.1 uncharacterized protein (DUF2236 family) [Conexibacter arvalis]